MTMHRTSDREGPVGSQGLPTHAHGSTTPRRPVDCLLVANYAPDEGFSWWLMENFWRETAQISSRMGLRSKLAYPKRGHSMEAGSDTATDIVYLPFPGKNLDDLIVAMRYVRKNNVRFVYFSDRNVTDWRYLPLRLAGVRLIVNHSHTGGEVADPPLFRGVARWLWRRLPWINCDQLLCVSPMMQERAVRTIRFPAARVECIQNGVDASTGKSSNPFHAHDQLGIDRSKKLCMAVGRADRNKRLDVLVSAAAIYVHQLRRQDIVFVHCGTGPEIESLEQQIQDLDLQDRFILAGKQNDVPALLSSATYAFHAAEREGFSLAILEFMRAGLAVLVPNRPSVCQAIENDRNGIIYPAGDAGAIATRLAALADDPERTAALGRRARAALVEKYSLEQCNAAFRAAITSALATIQRP